MVCMMTDFDIINFPVLDVDVPRCTSYALYILQLGFKSGICLLIAPVPVHCFSITFIMFARVCSHVDDFNARNKC